MTINEAIEHALAGDAVLFTGAGFSRGALNRRNIELKNGAELALHLATAAGLPPTAPLEDSAEAFKLKFGYQAIIDELKEEFLVTKVTPQQTELCRVPWHRVYTTNYDNVFEVASAGTTPFLQILTVDDSPFSIDPGKRSIIHLNGSISNLSPTTLDNSFKLTETSYITASIANSPWAVKLREDIRLSRSVFFLGYSMYDLDIRRLLYDSPHLKNKCFFIVGSSDNPLLTQRVSRYGTRHSVDTVTFATEVANVRRTYFHPLVEQPLISLREILPPETQRPPTDQEVFDLFELGRIEDAVVLSSLHSTESYYLRRNRSSQILTLLAENKKAIAITALLGNGKTLMLRGLAYEALEQGYRVFEAHSQQENAAREFERITQLPGKILVLIDNYQNWLREIQAIAAVKNDNVQLVVAARHAIHDVLFERLEEMMGLSTIPELYIDKLTDAECTWFVNTLDRYGLWRSRSGQSVENKFKAISDEFGGEVHGILLSLLESKDIGRRIASLITELQGSPRYFEIISTTFITALMGFPCTIDLLADIWGVEVLSSSQFKSNSCVAQLIDFSTEEARIKSSTVSAFTLRSIPAKEIVNILIRLTTHVSKAGQGGASYRVLLSELARFANIQRILKDSDLSAESLRYYEAIKILPQFEHNPLFWLQYAIASLVAGDLKRAKIYFDVAYSHAERTGFNTYQIDNHFARFLLQEVTNKENNIEAAMEKFRLAHSILSRQAEDERRHYTYKTAKEYRVFVDKFGSQLTESMCKEITGASSYILDRVNDLPDFTRGHIRVKECIGAMKYVIERCETLSTRRTTPPPTPPLPTKSAKQDPRKL